jgi:hypothetical protein
MKEKYQPIYFIRQAIISSEHRGNGYYSALQKQMVNDFISKHPSGLLICCTKHDGVKHLNSKMGFIEQDPIVYQKEMFNRDLPQEVSEQNKAQGWYIGYLDGEAYQNNIL